jgi:hypothetical protein
MTLPDLLAELCRLGVKIVISGDELKLRAQRGVITDGLRQAVAAHRREIVEAFSDGTYPDETLPDVIKIPAWLPNTEAAIKSCIDSLRLKAA